MKQIILFVFILFFILSCTQTKEINSELFLKLQESEKLFQKGLMTDDPLQKDHFFRSASILEELISQDKIENGYIYYNAANGWMNSDHIGKAIISYKKALQLLPNNKNIRNNLELARSTVQYSIEKNGGNPLLETLFFVHYDLSFQMRFAFLIFLTFCIFTTASIYLFKKRLFFRNLIFLLSICGILLGTSIIVDLFEKTEGVITSQEIVSRKGDSEGYENSFSQPLTEGVEFKLLSERNGWYYIEITDGRTCWIPQYSAELLD